IKLGADPELEKAMRFLLYSLLWTLPIINYLWGVILDMTPDFPIGKIDIG
ncbi:hypothetical protein SAMN05192582_11631, partial [Bacteroides ovatus]